MDKNAVQGKCVAHIFKKCAVRYTY